VKGNSSAIYRYRREHYFAKPPAAIWPFVSDTARLWDLNGYAPVQFDERVDAQGRVRRFVNGKLGFFPARWEEDFGEWQENHRLFQVREYQNGPMRRWEWACELIAEGEGCRLIFTGMAEPAGLLGFVGKHVGVFDAAFGKAAAGIERIIRESDGSALVPGWSADDLVEPAARQRLDALGMELARDPASHALAPNLIDYLRHAPIVDLRSIRPVALGDAMVRSARSCRGVVSGGSAEGRGGDGMGAALPALPRREVSREPASGPAERRALLLLQHRL
jgi:hypothetical protein